MKHICTLAAAVMAALLAGCGGDEATAPTPEPPKIVKTLNTPAEGAVFDLESTNSIVFEWAAATSRASDVTYEIVFDIEGGDFAVPLYKVSSDGTGGDTKATIPKAVLINIAQEAGADHGESAALIWSVIAKSGDNELLSEAKKGITLKRPALDPAVVRLLKNPADAKQIELKTTESLTFEWDAATWLGEGGVTYELVFDRATGTFASPLRTFVSSGDGSGTSVTLTKADLDGLVGLAGGGPGGSATLKWKVSAQAGGVKTLSAVSRSITLKRPPLDPAIVTTLKNPADDKQADLKTTETLTFEWDAATWPGEGGVTYELVFDRATGTFASPLKVFTSSGLGAGTSVTLTREEMNGLAELAGTASGETAALKWTVRTKSGTVKTLSEVSRSIGIKPSFVAGEALYIAGTGSEAGQKLRFVQDGATKYYEIYTKLTANLPYYFYSGTSDGAGARFSVNAAGTGFSDVTGTTPTSAKVGTTGLYRLRLYFGTKAATIEPVTKVAIRYAINSRDASLTYVEKGTWKIENYNVLLQKESWGTEKRYRFIFTINGTSEYWGLNQSAPAAANGERTMKKVASDMWSGVWDYPPALRDDNNLSRYYTDVMLNMNTRNENYYTHNFQDWTDSEAYYNGSRTIPTASVWAAAADSCTFTLIDQFMNKTKGTFWASANNVLNNSSVLYWQQAYPMHTMMYSFQRIKDSNPALAAQYKNYATLWITNKGNNWYGTKKNGFYNEYTDDMAWMALVFLHMYETWGEAGHLTYAKEIYGYMTEATRIREDANGWSLIWNSNSGVSGWNSRNACTNTPAIIIAAKLYQITHTQQYLDEAVKMYNYRIANSTVGTDGRVEEPALTYTQGTWIEGCRLLYHITNDSKYMDNATKAAKYTMTSGRCTNGAGLLRDEGSSGDQSNFKGGLIPYMVNYVNDTSMPADTRQQVKTFLIYNARLLWFHNMDKTLYPKTFANFSWNSVYNVANNPGSLGAHNSAAALMEGITRLQ